VKAILRHDFVGDAYDVYLRERGPRSAYYVYRPGREAEDALVALVEALDAQRHEYAGVPFRALDEDTLQDAQRIVERIKARQQAREGSSGPYAGFTASLNEWEAHPVVENAAVTFDNRPALRLPEDVLRAIIEAGSETLPPDRAMAQHLADAITVRDRILDAYLPRDLAPAPTPLRPERKA